MPVIKTLPEDCPSGLDRISVSVDRYTLEKRRWRTTATDGKDIVVDLEKPCEHGAVLYLDESGAYLVDQLEEAVIQIPIPGSTAEAAKLGWFLGNQHLQVEINGTHIVLAHDDQLVRKLDREHIHWHSAKAVFCPDPHSKSHHHH
jgi:urease accessory protein UreE